MNKNDRIKELLKNNYTPSVVANTVGVEVSYVQQLCQDEDFANEVLAARINILTSQTARDSKYDSLEDKLLDGLEMKLANGVAFMKMEVILRAIQTINSAKRRGAAADPSAQAAPTNVVNLIMPTVILKQYRVNDVNEVIAVGEQQLISQNSRSIMDRLKTQMADSNRPALEHRNDPDPASLARIAAATMSTANL